MEFYILLKICTKILVEIISKNVSGRYSQKLLDHVKQSAIDTLKTASKKQIRKPQKQLMIWLIIKLLIELQKP